MYIFVYKYLLLVMSYKEYRATELKISKFFLQSVFNEAQFFCPCSSVGVHIISYILNNLILSAFRNFAKSDY